ncbi:hypothetical protein PUN28_017209 [Cardiocondyla obscurior]|uniref:Uncharacterized protein n=1 Tax=Cardiocondyla obscurior TaxID=286306 RepID=A0AAW2ER65_9HYME
MPPSRTPLIFPEVVPPVDRRGGRLESAPGRPRDRRSTASGLVECGSTGLAGGDVRRPRDHHPAGARPRPPSVRTAELHRPQRRRSRPVPLLLLPPSPRPLRRGSPTPVRGELSPPRSNAEAAIATPRETAASSGAATSPPRKYAPMQGHASRVNVVTWAGDREDITDHRASTGTKLANTTCRRVTLSSPPSPLAIRPRRNLDATVTRSHGPVGPSLFVADPVDSDLCRRHYFRGFVYSCHTCRSPP